MKYSVHFQNFMVIAQWNRDDVEQVDGAGGSQLHPLAVGLGVVGVILLVLVVTASSHQRERLKMMARRALQSKIKTDGKNIRYSTVVVIEDILKHISNQCHV